MSLHPLGKTVSPETRHAYLLGRLEQLQELAEISPDLVQSEIQAQLIKIKELWEETLRERRDENRSRPRYFWEDIDIGRIWLDDPKFCTIGPYKIAPYWQLEIEKFKKTIILPPSLPFFVGKVGEPPNDEPPAEGYALEVFNLIKNKITCVADLKYLWNPRWKAEKGTGEINKRLEAFGGSFYLDYQDIDGDRVWKVRWGVRYWELVRWDDAFLLEIIRQTQAIANKEKTPQQVWDWLGLTESSFAAEAYYQGKKIVLKPYPNGTHLGWRLTYNRQAKWMPKRLVGEIHRGLKEGRFEDVLKYHENPDRDKHEN